MGIDVDLCSASLSALTFAVMENWLSTIQAGLTLIPLTDIIRSMYSVKEAAQRLRISDRHLRLLLEKGQVRGKKLGHDWVVLSLNYKRKRKPREK